MGSFQTRKELTNRACHTRTETAPHKLKGIAKDPNQLYSLLLSRSKNTEAFILKSSIGQTAHQSSVFLTEFVINPKKQTLVFCEVTHALTAFSRDVRHQHKIVCVAGGVLAAGASCRLFGQLQEVGRAKWRRRKTVFSQSLHVWERLWGQRQTKQVLDMC